MKIHVMLRSICVLFSLVSSFDFVSAQIHEAYSLQPRFFLFNALSERSCTTIFTGTNTGICTRLFSCLSKGGRTAGKCPFSFHVCCLIDEELPLEEQTLENPNSTLRIQRRSEEYCQVKVEFLRFSLATPDRTNSNNAGNCLHDEAFWTVSGHDNSNQVPAKLCGENTGQQLYLNFNTNGYPIVMRIVNPEQFSDWEIRTTQIRCDDEEKKAPRECLQYFTNPSDTVTSFNYLGVSIQHLNFGYKVCIRKEHTVKVLWELIDVDISPAPANTINDACTEQSSNFDFLEIPGGMLEIAGVTEMVTKICAPIQSTGVLKTTSSILIVNFNENENTELEAEEDAEAAGDPFEIVGRRGFLLRYFINY